MRAFVLGNYMNANFMQVDRLPMPGESLAAHGVFQEHGGKGLNLGLGLHRLGVDVAMLMAIGADDAGRAVKQRLEQEGLSSQLFLTLGDHSGYGVGFVAPSGQNFLAAYMGANALLNAVHVDDCKAQIMQANVVMAQFEVPDVAILRAFELAKSAARTTYLNPSPWRRLSAEMMAMTDILVVNATEAACLFGNAALESMSVASWMEILPALAQAIHWPGKYLIVTLAEFGSVVLLASNEVKYVQAFKIQQVDATGAGDAFGCGLVSSLLQGQTMTEALRYGNAAGAIVAAHRGIFDVLPDATELKTFIAQAEQSN